MQKSRTLFWITILASALVASQAARLVSGYLGALGSISVGLLGGIIFFILCGWFLSKIGK
jgi:hypothetical protein